MPSVRAGATAKREVSHYLLLPPEAGGISGRNEVHRTNTAREADAGMRPWRFFVAEKTKIWGRRSASACPFCGSGDSTFAKIKRSKHEPAVYAVRCSQCGAQGPVAQEMADANALWKEREDGDGR